MATPPVTCAGHVILHWIVSVHPMYSLDLSLFGVTFSLPGRATDSSQTKMSRLCGTAVPDAAQGYFNLYFSGFPATVHMGTIFDVLCSIVLKRYMFVLKIYFWITHTNTLCLKIIHYLEILLLFLYSWQDV
jgi:hypothetical protein